MATSNTKGKNTGKNTGKNSKNATSKNTGNKGKSKDKNKNTATTLIKWGSLKFRTDSYVIRSIDGFQASTKIKGSDSKCKKAYTEPEEVKFDILTSLETGGNPLKDYNYLKSFINANGKGKKVAMKLSVQEPYENYETGYWIGGGIASKKSAFGILAKSLGQKVVTRINYKSKLTVWKGAKFKLQSVTMKDVQMDGKGRIHAARLGLSFLEAPGNIGKGVKQIDPKTGKEVVKYKDFDGSWKQVKKIRSQSCVKNTW